MGANFIVFDGRQETMIITAEKSTLCLLHEVEQR
jgi:hypothetical protein